MNQPLPVAIAAWAMAGVGCGYLVMVLAYALRAAPQQMAEPPNGRWRRLAGALVMGPVLFGALGSVAVLALMLVSTALIAARAPNLVYLFTGAAAAFALWRGHVHSSYGMEGCSKAIILCWSAYALCWSAASLWLVPGPAPASWPAGDALRPLAVSALPAALVYRLSRDRRKIVTALGFFVCIAMFAAVVFFPIEYGWAHNWLPRSDWLRFPLAGAVASGGLVLLPQLARAIAGRRSASSSRRKRAWRAPARALAFACGFGALLGLFWAVTRAITIAI